MRRRLLAAILLGALFSLAGVLYHVQTDPVALASAKDAADTATTAATKAAATARRVADKAVLESALTLEIAEATKHSTDTSVQLIESVLQRKTAAEEAMTSAELEYYSLSNLRRKYDQKAQLRYIRAQNNYNFVRKTIDPYEGWLLRAVREVKECAEGATDAANGTVTSAEIVKTSAHNAEASAKTAARWAKSAGESRWVSQASNTSREAVFAANAAAKFVELAEQTYEHVVTFSELAENWNKRNQKNNQKIVVTCARIQERFRRAEELMAPVGSSR